VLKDASGERLLGAVRRTLEGESPLNQELAMRLLKRLAKESSSGEGGAEGGSKGVAEETPEETQEQEREPLASRPEAHQAGSSLSGQSNGAGQIETLTPREVEVLKLLSQGQTNPQIAQNLLFSVSTVKAQVRSILSKLGVSDRTQAAVRAIESRLTISGID
jgi:DNA-binding NarL/FixJ family response regulator